MPCQSELSARKPMPGARKPTTGASPTQVATASQSLDAASGEAPSPVVAQVSQPAENPNSPGTAALPATALPAATLPKALASAEASASPETSALPLSSSSPQILIYDGDCHFCVRRARWFQRRSRSQNMAVAYQNLHLDEVGLTQDVVSREAVWIDSKGRHFYGHKAIAKSLQHIGGLWGVLGRVMLVPPFSWLAKGTYRLTASNRHRL